MAFLFYEKSKLYLKDYVHQALRLKAADSKQSMSELVNDKLKASLPEDLEDIKSWRERKDEETYGYEV